MKNFRKILVAALMISGSQLAMAEGLYVLGAVGSAIPASSVKTDTDTLLTALGARNLSSSMSNGISMAGGLGYAINENFSVEGGYLNSGKMTYTATATGATITADSTVTAMQVAFLGVAPMNDKFSLFGKIGYSWATTKTSATVNAVSSSTSTDKNSSGYGVGAMYKFTDQLSLRASYEIYGSDLTGVLVGLQLKF
jgi:outer membrane autotransporter protein